VSDDRAAVRGASVISMTSRLSTYAITMTAPFRGITMREGMLFEGPAGWAEFSPFWDYDAAACRPWWRAALESATTPFPEPVRTSVPVNCTIPAVDPARAATIAAHAGCRTAKVKVAQRGQTLADDLARVEAVRDALGPQGLIRVDANGAWDVDQAVSAIAELDRAAGGLEYVEQPCAGVEELAACRRRATAPIAADESIRWADDPLRVARLGAADIAVLKVQPLGGIRTCLRIAEDIGIPVVVSSALETSVGISAGVALAAALPDLPFACGLATGALLDGDVATPPLAVVDGELPVRRAVVKPAALARVTADGATTRRWQDRLAAVRALGEEPGR
jgi:O-succinylbenzoate synthase